MTIAIANHAQLEADKLLGRFQAQGFYTWAQWEIDGEYRIMMQKDAPLMALEDFGSLVENAAIGLTFRPKTISRHDEWSLYKVAYQYLPNTPFEKRAP